MNRRKMKDQAQKQLLHGIANVIGYAEEQDYGFDDWHEWSEADRDAFRVILQREADRVAKLFGYEKAWTN